MAACGEKPVSVDSQEQHQDDDEVRPVPEHPGEDHGDLNHPRDRPPEVAEELEELILLLLLELVRTVAGQPFGRFALGETVLRPSQA
jgi:hypothetical protein